MVIKVKSLLIAVSLIANGFFVLFLILLLFSSSMSNNLTLSVHAPPDDGYITAAAVAGAPKGREVVFNAVEITLKPREKAFLQFLVSSDKKQANLLITPLYDPEIISVTQTGSGLDITALVEGVTLIQYLANDGIKDIALIIIEE